MKITHFNSWDESQINHFIDLKKNIQGHQATYFPESLLDYKKILHSDSPFSQDYKWHGILIFENEIPVAKAILCWKNNSIVGNVGFIDWIDDNDVAKTLMAEIEKVALQVGLSNIKTPVDMNFFIKYRIKMPGGGHPIFGEPVYPDYYHDLFKITGYEIIGTWDTYKVKKGQIIKSFFRKRKQLSERRHPFDKELRVRSIQLSHWERELKIVYELFIKSFSQMPEYEPITYDQFKIVYDDFKHIIHPWYSYIVELRGVPVGFSINYPDPLPVLEPLKGKKLSKLAMLWLFIKLRTNFKTMLMIFVGKIPGPNGEEIKGILIKTTKQLSARGFYFKEGLACYQSSNSPSRRSIDTDAIVPFSQYVLYGKKLK